MRALKAVGLSLLSACLWSLAWAILNFKTEAIIIPLHRDGLLGLDTTAFYAGRLALWQIAAGLAFPWFLGRLGARLSAAPAVLSAAGLATFPVLLLGAVLVLRHPGTGTLALVWWGTSLAAAVLTAFVLSRLADAAPAD